MSTVKLTSGSLVIVRLSVVSMEKRKGRNQRNYIAFDLQTGNGQIKGYLWSHLEMAASVRHGSTVEVQATVKLLNGAAILQIKRMMPVSYGSDMLSCLVDDDQTELPRSKPQCGYLWPEMEHFKMR